jgi:hypothetical protein
MVSVTEAVEQDLEAMRAHAPEVADSALAASALALAALCDDEESSTTSRAMCHRALHEALAALRDLAPPVKKADGIDEINRKREARRAAARGADSARKSRS